MCSSDLFGYDFDGSSWAWSYTDRGTEDAPGTWGAGGALDNFLVNPAVPVGDGRFNANFYTSDDDSFGLVVGQQDAGSYYLFVLCGASGSRNADCPIELSSDTGAALVKIDRGTLTVLDETSDSYAHDSEGVTGELAIRINDGVLTATYSDAGITLTATDSTFTSVDSVGFWAYNAGYEDDSWTGFNDPRLYAMDDDSDEIGRAHV